ncbi:PREDICTED: myb family transcription factor EFM-like [Ipomoea nil]|uniref:myb family transcription factor EFM-like n=1 Tax=Ipomoea nil TaxID=35883 RepID=UPI000900C9DD|nr:PREDICTED: myb family transcription factor EFM-like [Ipomoea nil]
MGANGRKLSIDLNSEFGVPKTISDCLAEVSATGDVSLKLSKLSYFLHALEEESRKIDAWRRELPLSMHIINLAIEKVKEEVLQVKRKEEGPVMEEFLPVKGDSDESDKKNWMNSATLWNNPVEFKHRNSVEDEDIQFRPGEFKNEGGAFQPYKKIAAAAAEKAALPINGLPASTPLSIDLRLKSGGGGGGSRNSQPQSKKQRRCWSPELHQRFIDALDKLGGAQAATPKQIIDIMRVDGLTNDEVKSHLQKYRLHVRRLPPPSSSVEQRIDALKVAKIAAQSGSPEGPLHLSASGKEISMTLTNIPEEEEEDDISESSWKKQGHIV